MSGVTNELYLHPDMNSVSGRREMKAVTSNRVRDRLAVLGVQPVGFRELTGSTIRHKRAESAAAEGR